MAIANSDGSIILSTRVDTTGVVKGMNQISLLAQRTGEKINLDFLYAKSAIDKLAISLDTVQAKLLLVLAVRKLVAFSNTSAKVAIQTEASVQRLVDIYGEASGAVGGFIDQNSKALGLSKSASASIAATYGNLLSVWADQATNAELTNALLNQTAVVASKTGRTTEDVADRIRSGLLGNTEAIEDLGINVNIKTIEITDAFKRIANGRSWEQLDAYEQSQIRTLAILEQSTKKYGNEVEETTATIRNRYDAAYQDFQNSWGNIVNKVLIPVLQVLTQIFDIATRGLNALSGATGGILGSSETQMQGIKETAKSIEATANGSKATAKNIEKQTKNQKELNNELNRSLARFDEIQVISAGSEKDEQKPNGGGDYQFDSSNVKQSSKVLEHMMRVIGGALAAVGILLLMTKSKKNKGWGIGFIIAGASIFAVSAAASIQEASDMGVGAVLNAIMGLIGDALVAVGIVLLFKGAIEWGIGFIITGAAYMAIEYFATTEFSTDPIVNTLVAIMGIAGTAMLAIGIILCVFGVITPISIGLIVGGAVALVSAVALSSDAIVEAIRGPIGAIMAIVSAALLVLGIILVCTGAGVPLGIGLILAGAAGLATVVAVNWNSIVDWVKGAWDAVKGFWNKYIAPVFTAKFWLDLAKACGNGLIAGFEGAINGVIWLFESMVNFAIDAINALADGLSVISGAIGSLFGQDWTIPDIPHLNLGRVSIPRLAKGAVLPPNKPFLSIVGDQKHGTNIEAPLSTIQEAVSVVMNDQNEMLQGLIMESVEVQREILEAVLGIDIGDDIIGKAAIRYNNRAAAIYGG